MLRHRLAASYTLLEALALANGVICVRGGNARVGMVVTPHYGATPPHSSTSTTRYVGPFSLLATV
jgi:hypothetical protein